LSIQDNITKTESEINELKTKLVKYNEELKKLQDNVLILGEDFFAYVEIEMLLNTIANEELSIMNNGQSAVSGNKNDELIKNIEIQISKYTEEEEQQKELIAVKNDNIIELENQVGLDQLLIYNNLLEKNSFLQEKQTQLEQLLNESSNSEDKNFYKNELNSILSELDINNRQLARL
jgi:spore germination protein YaaH